MLGVLECIPEKGASTTGLRRPGSGGDAGRVTGRAGWGWGWTAFMQRPWVRIGRCILWKQREASRLVDTCRSRLMMPACRPC